MILKDDAASVAAWYKAHGCNHAHCPRGCEHPQPRLVDGVMACGRCLVLQGVLTPCEPCTPRTCEGEQE